MNNHIYSLDYVLLTLKLVIKHLDFDEEDIFRYGSDKDQPPLQALKDYISLILNKKKSKDSLPEFIFDFNHKPENIEKKLQISPNTLSKLSQEVMIHGCLLDKSNLKVLAAWTLLCHELYTPWTLLGNSATFSNTAQTKPTAFLSYLTANKFQHIFNDFLNTLCAIDSQKTAEAFHLFLYLTHLVTLHEKNNQTTQKGIANIQSICLTNGLELENVLSTIDPPNSDTPYSALLKQENVLFSEMIGHLTKCEKFKKPFSKKDYRPNLSKQFSATYEKMIASVWGKPNIAIVPYSHDIFVTTPKSNHHLSILPCMINNNSETIKNDFPAYISSPRDHKKNIRTKRSFDFPKKINREKKSFSREFLEITKTDKKNVNSSLTHRSSLEVKSSTSHMEIESQTRKKSDPITKERSSISSENALQHIKPSIHRNTHTLDKLETVKKSHHNNHPPKLNLVLNETDELIQILQSLTFNESDLNSTEENHSSHQSKKNKTEKKAQPNLMKKKDEYKNESKPLLHQHGLDSQPLSSRKTPIHSSRKKFSEASQSTQNSFPK